MAPFSDVSVIFTSNVTKQRVFKALEAPFMSPPAD